MISKESTVESLAFLLQNPDGDINACFPQLQYPSPVYLVETIPTSDDYARNLLFDDKVGTRRSLPIVGTGFQAHIDGGLAEQVFVAHGANGIDFGMRASTLAVISLTDDGSVVHNYRSYHRIRSRLCPSASCQLQASCHISFVRGHRCFAFDIAKIMQTSE